MKGQIKYMHLTKRKPWTQEDDNLLRKLYPESSSAAVGDVLGRSTTSVYDRAHQIKVRKYKKIKDQSSVGYINLIHNNGIIRNKRLTCATDLTEAVQMWYHEIKPALKRGEKISVEIQLDKIA